MNICAMIQARCNSNRLKNKVLLPLNGKTVLECVLEGVRKSKMCSKVVVITSYDTSDDPIEELCKRINTMVYRGSINDVLDRFYQASLMYDADYYVRITADCPLYDGGLLDEAIKQLHINSDFLGMMTDSFADGLDIEIIKKSALEKAWRESKNDYEREHVTQYIRNNPDKFAIQNFESDIPGFGNCRWTIDEERDYEFLKRLFFEIDIEQIEIRSYRDIYVFLQRHKEISSINSGIQRNEGLLRQLQQQRG